MINDDTLSNVQVAHLFLKAHKDQIIGLNEVRSALGTLFPSLLPPPISIIPLPDNVTAAEANEIRRRWLEENVPKAR